jgi:alpha-1,6-mannosyltransferase
LKIEKSTERIELLWWAIGISLAGIFIVLALISKLFDRKIPLIEQPVLILVAILITSGILYLLMCFLLAKTTETVKILILIIVVGTTMRLCMLFSTPILEDDYFRYLWDGAVLTNGINPYAYSPEQVIQDQNRLAIPPKLHKLADQSGNIILNINHPGLRSIYPPISQSFFGLAHWLNPWSIFSWKMTLLFFDFLTLALLIHVLRILNLPLLSLAVYWWNPLLVKEIFNSGHFDSLAFPFVLGAVMLAAHARYLSSILSLALAAGVKIWPVALLPLILRPLISNQRRLVLPLGLFCILVAILFLPAYLAGLDESSGFNAYAERWENNSSVFKLILWGSQFILNLIDIHPGHGQKTARIVVFLLAVLWTVYVSFTKTKRPSDVFEKCLLIIAGVFFLSPTQFPWYYTWMIPFLAIHPRLSLLLLTVLLPLYYLRYYFEPRGLLRVSIYGIVWIEFIPAWILLFREWYLGRKEENPPNQMRINTLEDA